MRGSFATSRAFLLVLGVLVGLTVSVVIAAAPLLTKSSEQPARARPRAPTTVPAPSQDPIPRFPPQLALHARAATNAPGVLRLRISTSGTFRPTTETPAQLRVVLTAAEATRTAPLDRIIRRVALTDGVLSAVFRHLQPGTWRWEVDAPSTWTLAFVNRDSGRAAVRAPAPPPAPPPAPEPVDNASEGAGAEAPAPEPVHESGSATTSTQSGVPAAQSPNPAPTQGGSGGQSNPPAPRSAEAAPRPRRVPMHRRFVISAAVLTVAVSTLVTLVVSPPAQAAYPVSRIGFRIPADGTASGSWLGSRTLGSRPVYLIDPARKLVSTRYAAAKPVKVLGSRRATARAAWILSRYGNQRGADRRYYAAATDVALDALLKGGKYGVTGSVTRRHLRESGRADTLRSWARYFLKVSKKYAGPYRVVISKSGATVGGDVTVRARITAAPTGAPIPHRPVRISYDGHRPVRLGTDNDGTVETRFTSTRPGDVPVTLRIGRLPASEMFVRAPSNRQASRAAVAGIRVVEARRFTVPVRGTPAIAVRPPATMVGPGLTSGSFTLDGVGGSAPNTATATVYGPFDSTSQAVCVDLDARASASVPVGGNGSYPLPQLRVPRYGIYVWKVGTAANRLNHEAERCGGKVRARSQPRLAVRADAKRVAVGKRVRATVDPAGLPDGYKRTGKVRLVGPFVHREGLSCAVRRTLATRRFTAEANVAHRTPSIKVTKKGYYAWTATVPSSYFSLAASSRCEARRSVFVVR